MCNILIIFHYQQYPLRATIRDHLYSFRKYSAHRCFYLNLALQRIPEYIKKIRFDLIIFHTVFLSSRWTLDVFKAAVQKARLLKKMNSVKIALPQDEFMNTNVLCDFINEFGIQHVFSVAPKSEWGKIYPTVDFKKVHFHRVLTGYLDDDIIAKVNRIKDSGRTREIDIGYRAWHAEPWLGSHGVLKTEIADLFQKKAIQWGLRTDISTRTEDTILGDSWYRFLLNCKYTIGVEGGASILDRDGKIREATTKYLAHHPDATFEEVKETCFKSNDNSLCLFAISPRHLEACLTRTCQVLVEGRYNDILIPGIHYIELKRNFENIDHVLETIQKDHIREEIVERVYQDIVESGMYSYRGFVHSILENSLGHVESSRSLSFSSIREIIIYYWMEFAETILWIRMVLYFRLFPEIRKRLPETFIRKLRELRWAITKKE